MRIWSIHPEYLDTKGLLALWREALLAKHVLEGRTKGYRNHPQLARFKNSADQTESINQYLSEVYYEAVKRGFKFDKEKIDWQFKPVQIPVTTGQLKFERVHLLKKLKKRDMNKHNELTGNTILRAHPLFKIIDGGPEIWEKI